MNKLQLFTATFAVVMWARSGLGMVIDSRTLTNLIQERLGQFDDEGKFPPRFRPDLLQISVRGFRNDERTKEQVTPDPRQIPVISDIERIKKVIEIIEFVGDKVGDILDNLPTPQALVSDLASTEKTIASNETENVDQNGSDTTVATSSSE